MYCEAEFLVRWTSSSSGVLQFSPPLASQRGGGGKHVRLGQPSCREYIASRRLDVSRTSSPYDWLVGIRRKFYANHINKPGEVGIWSRSWFFCASARWLRLTRWCSWKNCVEICRYCKKAPPREVSGVFLKELLERCWKLQRIGERNWFFWKIT